MYSNRYMCIYVYRDRGIFAGLRSSQCGVALDIKKKLSVFLQSCAHCLGRPHLLSAGCLGPW